MESVKLSTFVKKMNLVNLTPQIDISKIRVTQSDVNRPALQLSGYYDHFDHERIQVIGFVEYTFLEKMSSEDKLKNFELLLSYEIPCVVFSRDLEPGEEFLKCAREKGIPVFNSSKTTSAFMAEAIRWLNVQLAPCISIHGVLVDVYGEGLLIMGESGIGKSEAALELVKRGHRLVSDDVVEIRRVSDDTLIGCAPNMTKHFIELRGVGIVDIKALYGVQSVKETQGINLVIKLEEWDREKEYDRMGIEDEYTEILGNKLVCHSIPIRPGRNLAIICELAAVNYRQKQMGYNAAQELTRRLQQSLMAEKEEE